MTTLTNCKPRAAGLVALLVGSLLTGTGCGRTENSGPRESRRVGPNVLLVTLDTTRADHLGCYGYIPTPSPRLDRLAAESTVFTRAVVSAAVTPVSHASILTGLYPYTHGLRTMQDRLPDGAVTLATVLQTMGYRTGAFVSSVTAGRSYGLDRGFETFDDDFLQSAKDPAAPGATALAGPAQRTADETTDRALHWLDRTPAPWLLWVHYFDPHDADRLPPREFLERFPAPAGSREDRLRGYYDLEIRFLDEQFGRLLDALREAGQWTNTIVVVVSDHGEGLGDHHWWSHGILYQEQVRAALIIKAPDAPGRRVGYLVRTIDLLPTILALAGVDSGRAVPMEGRSLVPLLERDGPDPGFIAYAEAVNLQTYLIAQGMADVKDDRLFAIADGRWKYIQHQLREPESELYDLATDPRELHNLYGAQPAQVARLRRELMARDFQPVATPGADRLPVVNRDRLRSLGYLK